MGYGTGGGRSETGTQAKADTELHSPLKGWDYRVGSPHQAEPLIAKGKELSLAEWRVPVNPALAGKVEAWELRARRRLFSGTREFEARPS